MTSFFACFQKPIGSKNPSHDIAPISDTTRRSSYTPSAAHRTSTSTTNSLDERSISTEKTCVDGRSSRPSTATSTSTQKSSKSRTLDGQSKPSQQSRHRHGLGSSRRALSQPAVSFSTPSIPRPPNYRKHSAFARRNEPDDAVPAHNGPCAQILKAILRVPDTIIVQPISVAIQQMSRVCFGGRVTTRRRPAWVARR